MIEYSLKQTLADTIGITESTYEHHITKLINEGVIVRNRIYNKKFTKLTSSGINEGNLLIKNLSKAYFTRKRHTIQNDIPLMEFIEKYSDPVIQIFLISLYMKKKEFDLIETLIQFGIYSRETSLFNLINDCNFFDHSEKYMPIVNFMKLSFGRFSKSKFNYIKQKEEYIHLSLIYADVELRRGNINKSQEIYDLILKNENLTRDAWFICRIGKIKTYLRSNETNSALNEIDTLLNDIDEKIPKSYVYLIKADYLSTIGEKKDAQDLFKSVIKTLEHYHCPELLGLVHNNLGCHYFSCGNLTEAERVWINGRKYCNEVKCDYIKGLIITNLASIARIKGNFQKCITLLEEAESLFAQHYVFEGISMVEYNKALLHISKMDIEKAKKHYTKSLEVAYPLPPTYQREERDISLLKEMKKLKYTPKEILGFQKIVNME